MGTLSFSNTASWKRALIWRRDGIPIWWTGIHTSPKGYAGLKGRAKDFSPVQGGWGRSCSGESSA